MTAQNRKLLSACVDRGTPVHAACFIRDRRIVLETELLRRPRLLRLILVHEIFHFAWARLGNNARREFADLLALELENRAVGELGESAGIKKSLLRADARDNGELLWRDYVCESFCDTAAWLYSGVRQHRLFALAKRWREKRRAWFEERWSQPGECPIRC